MKSYRHGLIAEALEARFEGVLVVVLALGQGLARHIILAGGLWRGKLFVVGSPAGRVDETPSDPLYLPWQGLGFRCPGIQGSWGLRPRARSGGKEQLPQSTPGLNL